MAQAPVMPLWTDALIADTTHLSPREFGCYMLLLIATWRNNGQPFPDDDKILARIVRMATYEWKSQIRKSLEPFFNRSDGFWRQKRLENEWRYVAKRAEISRANGRLGGRSIKSTGKTPPRARLEVHGQGCISMGCTGSGDKSLELNGLQNPAGSLQGNPEGTQKGTQNEPAHIHKNKPNGLYKSANALSSAREIAKAMMAVFREVCTSLTPPVKLTPPRQRQCRARLAEDLGGDLDQWRALCQRVQRSPFLSGLKTDWRADFDWLLKPANFTKVMEGKFDPDPQGGLHGLQLSEEERQAGLAEARRQAGLRVADND